MERGLVQMMGSVQRCKKRFRRLESKLVCLTVESVPVPSLVQCAWKLVPADPWSWQCSERRLVVESGSDGS